MASGQREGVAVCGSGVAMQLGSVSSGPPHPVPPSCDLSICREIGFIVYGLGKPLEPFLQKQY